MAYGVTNILGALLGGLPTATYSQNVGIVTTTKVINRWVLGLAAAILGVAGIVPKFSALLTTIPQCVLGGATVSVFASIAMTWNEAGLHQQKWITEILPCRTCRCNWSWCLSGIYCTCQFPGLGNY